MLVLFRDALQDPEILEYIFPAVLPASICPLPMVFVAIDSSHDCVADHYKPWSPQESSPITSRAHYEVGEPLVFLFFFGLSQ